MTPILGQTANRADSRSPNLKQGRPDRADNSAKLQNSERIRKTRVKTDPGPVPTPTVQTPASTLC